MSVMALADPSPGGSHRRSRRRRPAWATGTAVSVVLHAAPLALLAGCWARGPVVAAPEAVFEVEMLQRQAPVQPPSEQPPGPQQTKAAPAPTPAKPVIDPRRQVTAPPDVETLTVAPKPQRVDDASQAPPAPETTAPPSQPAPPAATAASARTWEGLLLAHLERRKRYPAEARAQRRQGVAYVRFSMDRQGRVLSAVLERGSGDAALDREAVALLGRAQPLPKPPPEITGDPISLSVPVEFFMGRRG
jgi:protein TonB